MKRKLKIALLSGGISREREVSLKTGEKIMAVLKKKYQVARYDPKFDFKKFINDALAKKFDLIFPALHGPFGEDGRLQGLLDLLGVRYVFSGTLASALAMNKHKTKIIARAAGLNVAADILFSTKKDFFKNKDLIVKLPLPAVIKPNELGSSVGSSICKKREEINEAINKAFAVGGEVLVEEFIAGCELTVTVMGQAGNLTPLPVIEIKPKTSTWFNYQAKYESGGSEEICPAPIDEAIKNKIQRMAVDIFAALGCKDLARADFILSQEDNKLYFLEINTIPGMTATSLAPQAAAAAGFDFPAFLDKLIEFNLK